MTILEHARQSLEGFAFSFQHTEWYNKGKEIRQGGNYVFSAFPSTPQFMILATQISRIALLVFKSNKLKTMASVLSNVVPIVGFLPLSLFCGVVKQGDYEKCSLVVNSKSRLQFPAHLNPATIKACNFVADHGDRFMLMAMIVSSLVLLILGQTAYAIGGFTAFAYNGIDRAGWVPRKVSLFCETYLPTVSYVGGIMGGNILFKTFSAVQLAFDLFAPLKWFFVKKIEAVAASRLGLKCPLLQEAYAPVVEKRKLKYTEIMEILEGDETAYEIDPAHCTLSLFDEKTLPVDTNFNQLLTLFDEIDWSKKYHIVKPKLLDDDKFQVFLHEKYPDVKKEEIKENFDRYMTELALKESLTKEQFGAGWVRHQMVQLVKVLTEEERAQGLQSDLEDAIQNFGKILPHLESLKDARKFVELEDALLKISVEAGDYCARGLKRTSNEMMRSLISAKAESQSDAEGFERQLKQKLLEERERIVESDYRALQNVFPENIKHDVHLYDTYRVFFSVAFLPLTSQDKQNFGLEQLGLGLYFEKMLSLRKNLFDQYQTRQIAVAQSIGMVEVSRSIHTMIVSNDSLSAAEKDLIENFWTSRRFTVSQVNHRFTRLLLVMLGLRRKKAL